MSLHVTLWVAFIMALNAKQWIANQINYVTFSCLPQVSLDFPSSRVNHDQAKKQEALSWSSIGLSNGTFWQLGKAPWQWRKIPWWPLLECRDLYWPAPWGPDRKHPQLQPLRAPPICNIC